jgi:hypothetical protein
VTPRIEWDPPALGSPTDYEVAVWQLGVTPNKRGKMFTQFRIPTLPGQSAPALRSFVFPPGILSPGNDYYFTVIAHHRVDEQDDEAAVATSEYRP